MAKIQFRIRNKDNVVIARAQMRMRAKLKSGKQWQSELLQATNAGVVWLEIPDRTLKAMDRRTIRYEITAKGKKLTNTAAAPEQVNDSTFKVLITVGDARRAEPPEPPVEPERESGNAKTLILISTLISQKEELVVNAAVDFIVRGKVISSVKSDKSGDAALHLSEYEFESIDWREFSIQVTANGNTLGYVSHTPIRKVGDTTWRTTVTLKKGGGSTTLPNGGRNSAFEVSGTVSADDKRPVTGITLKAFHISAGKEQPLGDTKTDTRGKYSITYGKNTLGENKSPNLTVRAYASAAAKNVITESSMKTGAGRQATIHLVINRKNYSSDALFDLVHQQIIDLNLENKLAGLSLNDAILIAKQAGLEQEVVGQYLHAGKMALGTMVLVKQVLPFAAVAEPFFGIIRAGLSPTAAAFATIRDAKLEGMLEKAAKEHWIDDIDPHTAVNAIRPMRVKLLLAETDEWALLLRGSGANEKQLEAVADNYLRTNLPLDHVIRKMIDDKSLPARVGKQMLALLELLQFAGGNQALLNGLAEAFGIIKPLDLIKLSLENWIKVVREYVEKIPAWIAGETPQQRTRNLAQNMRCTVEALYATPFFIQRWKEDKKLPADSINWLTNNPELELNRETLKEYAKRTGKAPPNNKLKVVQRIERLFQLSPDCDRFPAFRALWVLEYQSARQVVDKGRGGFIREMAGEKTSEVVATEIFKRAQRVTSQNLLSLQPVPVGVPDKPATGATGLVRVEPTIAALFGDKGGNGCDHCISAFGPSAYLVDMLRFLERSSTDPNPARGKSGLDLLFARRPDIKNLQLDCENSHTPLPYIDLVNELLEHIVATARWPNFQVPKDWLVEATLDLNTEWTAEELAAHPEHLQIEAYNRLRHPLLVAPWSLPYNLWADEVRTYLEQIGVDRTALMHTLLPDDNPDKIAVLALERMGVTPAEIPILNTPATSAAKIALVWQTANPATDLKNIRNFLRRVNLDFDRVAQIFSTRFVNPASKQILPTDLRDLEIADLNFTQQDNEGLLDRFHRFSRLLRKFDWSSIELDAVLQNLLEDKLDRNALTRLGIAAELYHQYGTPPEELATWFGRITNRGNSLQSGFYHRLFLDGTVSAVVDSSGVNLLEEVFALTGDAARRDLVVTQSSVHDKWLAEESAEMPGEWILQADYSPVVLAGCRVSAEEVTTLIKLGLLPVRGKKVALNLANISQIYRFASMARALKISVQSLTDWQQLTGMEFDPENSSFPGAGGLLLILHGIRTQIEAGIDAATLRYAFQNAQIDNLTPATEEISLLLMQIRGDLQKAAGEFIADPLTPQAKIELWAEIMPAWPLPEFPEVSDPDELSEKISALIPLDVDLLHRVQLLLTDAGISEQDTLTLLTLLSEQGNATSALPQFEELLPQINHSYLQNQEDDRVRSAAAAYFDSLVRSPIVIQHLATTSGLEDAQVAELSRAVAPGEPPLVSRCLQAEFVNAEQAASDIAQAGVERFLRQATLVSAAGLDANEIAFSLQPGVAATGIFDYRNIGAASLIAWQNTLFVHQIQNTLGADRDLYGFLTAMLNGEYTKQQAVEQLALLFEVSASDLFLLVGETALDLEFPNAFQQIFKLHRLYAASGYLGQIDVTAEHVVKLGNIALNVEHANIAKAAVRAHYDDINWREVSQKLRSGIRQRQRDALLEFVRTRRGWDLSHEQAYAFYLIDVDMGACYETSRTKQAIASVQQFIQRILLGLEYEGVPGNSNRLQFFKEDAAEWKWRKNYRVWEANVKVFVYPENWLEPELRDNKTNFFEEFEQELMQGELTHDLAESAVTNYLEKLHMVSDLEIVNCYEVTEDPYSLHVIGRTHNLPHQFYYRRWNKELWTPWEKIDADIEGDQVVPAVYNNTLFLFWAIFSQELNEDAVEDSGIQQDIDDLQEQLDAIEGPTGSLQIAQDELDELQGRMDAIYADNVVSWEETLELAWVGPQYQTFTGLVTTFTQQRDDLNAQIEAKERQLEAEKTSHSFQAIKLHWITRTASGWSAKSMTKEPLHGPEGIPKDDYLIMVEGRGTELELYVLAGDFDYRNNGIRETQTVAKYVLSSCSGTLEPEHQNLPAISPLQDFSNSERLYTQHIVYTSGNWESTDLTASGTPLLAHTAGSNVTATKHQYFNRATPFFAHIGDRTFFVSKSETTLLEAGAGKGDAVQTAGTELHRFSAHYHPYTCAFMRQIRRFGVDGLYQPSPNEIPGDNTDAVNLVRQLTPNTNFNFDSLYQPFDANVDSRHPKETIDFSLTSAYGMYNWEVFFHIPIYIADRLTTSRRFEEAQRWLHNVFDPTESSGTGLQKYWNTKPFYYAQLWDVADDDLQEELERIDDDPAISLETLIDEWETHPFQPHLIARFRIVSYMRKTVMRYLDNLIAWGDSLFKQDSMESINEATQLYVLAANILGERPLVLEDSGKIGEIFTVQEYLQGHALRPVPAGTQAPKPQEGYAGGAQGILGVLDQFCIPFNDRQLEYWDLVADRLFKIRHCQNIDGVFRKLPLFQPPIDPALLVKAAASGVDLSSVLSNLGAPRPRYRFTYMTQKTTELIGLVQNLGSSLLSALEKRDAEELSRLRAENEVELLKLGLDIRKEAIREAKLNIEVLQQGQALAQIRQDFYAGRKYMNAGENFDMVLRAYSWYLRTLSQVAQAAVTPLSAIPTFMTGAAGVMGSPVALTTIPEAFKPALSAVQVLGIFADLTQTGAGMAQTVGQFDRRQEEWDHQVEMTSGEISQFDKQIAAADIRLAMAEKERANHEVQIEKAEEAKAFIKDKFTNSQLYSWMSGQLSTLFFQTYQLAYDMAKGAERCYQHELGVFDTNFIQFGYWDSMKKGLLAGERLRLDLKRMESSYIDNNDRELELSKTISLAMLNPESLLRLRETGECYLTIPESMFDLDYPGHYFRRIKSVSLTLPAITGPYTTVSCTLTLLSDKYRKDADTSDDEANFEWNVGAIQSIATSSAQNDSGLFQLDFRDERYLPFERAGVTSSWKLNLPKPDIAQFDYATISDVLIQFNYTARDGGQNFRTQVETQLISSLNSLVRESAGFPQLISVRHMFPNQWAAFLGATDPGSRMLDLTLSTEHLPYFIRRKIGALQSVKGFVLEKVVTEGTASNGEISLNGSAPETLQLDPLVNVPSVTFQTQDPIGPLQLTLTGNILGALENVDDIALVVMVALTD